MIYRYFGNELVLNKKIVNAWERRFHTNLCDIELNSMISHIYYVKGVNSFTNPVDYKHIAKTCAPEELSKKIEDRMIYEMDRMGCEDENIQVPIGHKYWEYL